jgi:hypothetical protein
MSMYDLCLYELLEAVFIRYPNISDIKITTNVFVWILITDFDASNFAVEVTAEKSAFDRPLAGH